jgi:hypothetical protein
MSGMPMIAASTVLLVGLTACGGQQPTTNHPTPEPEEPSVTAGALVPDALVDARCAPDPSGVWSASGVLKNATKKPMSYDVIVHLGAANGEPATAHVKRVRNIGAGKSQDFTVAIVDDKAPTGPCHVQVRAAAEDDD